MSLLRSIAGGLLAVSLVLAGVFGAVLNKLPAHIAYFGITMTLFAVVLAIAIAAFGADRPAHCCSCSSELEQARQNLANVSAIHMASIKERAACPWCREQLGPSIDDSIWTFPPGDAA